MKGKFFIAQKELQSMLASMQPICSKRTTLDVTESILFQVAPKELTLKSTDLEISLQSNSAIESDLTDTGRFLISGKRIFDLVKEIDGQIECIINENHLTLKADGVDLLLNIRNAEDFPPFPERIENLMEINASFLLNVLNKVSFVIPHNNANIALNGMLLECNKSEMMFVATDGHCLAKVSTKKYTLENASKWLLPKRAVLELKKILENTETEKVFLGVCGSQLVFSGINFNFFTKLIVEQFPQYKPVLEKEGFVPAKVLRPSLVKTLRRAGCLLAGQFVAATFAFKEGAIDISLHNKEVGKLDETLALAEYKGESVQSRFFSPYLLSGLQSFPEDEVKFFIKDASRPIIFESNQADYHVTYLVMPVSATQDS